MTKAEKATRWMEDKARDNSHGYDQTWRWGEKEDYDCSAAVISAWQAAGVPVKDNGATFTGNMYKVFMKCGFKDVTAQVDIKTGKGLRRGDVLLRKGKHTAMYCGGGKEVEASINELGKARGGKTGDQTGREFLIRSYRNYPWDCVLRYQEKTPAKKESDITQVAKDVIAGRYGNGADRKKAVEAAGYDYAKVQKKVNELLKK
ncbi:MAG: NlpC/P60 family protein [Candidatus Weimeria sp.]